MTGLVPRLPRLAWLVFGGDALSAVGSGLTLPFLLVYLHQIKGTSYGLAVWSRSKIGFVRLTWALSRRQAARMYSLMRPLRTGFRRIRCVSRSVTVMGLSV